MGGSDPIGFGGLQQLIGQERQAGAGEQSVVVAGQREDLGSIAGQRRPMARAGGQPALRPEGGFGRTKQQ